MTPTTQPEHEIALGEADHAALARILRRNPEAEPRRVIPHVPPTRIPRHVAIIMDGNGRWAKARDLPRSAGHAAGATAVERALQAISWAGVEALTLYSFSSENWTRPADEVDALMTLCVAKLKEKREFLVEHNIRLRHLGRRQGLPRSVLDELDATIAATARCTGPTLCLALNYGSRDEIIEAARFIATKAAKGELEPADIDEQTIADHLGTAGIPDPDLLIRTSGEFRVSNFLLWQISYAEIVVTDTLWPDFAEQDLYDAITEYAGRSRRFGATEERAEPC
ncbi:MAG: di-trans,poly-cis-decaprenylcistransferase [Phycisphaeraceae bacterium]|nr:di-trans,poly-cis-decaprenylcistransferase [Phycisphaeraceae bacterium]